jgi:predicted nucleic acid-binding protein
LGVTQERTDRFITDLGKYTQFLEGFPKVFSYDRDEDDAPYIDLAHSAGAEYLVSRDNDLLDLMRAETSVGRSFASQFPNLKVVRPPDFLRELERIKTPDHGGA